MVLQFSSNFEDQMLIFRCFVSNVQSRNFFQILMQNMKLHKLISLGSLHNVSLHCFGSPFVLTESIRASLHKMACLSTRD